MKKLFYGIAVMAWIAGADAQTVGVGTTVPDSAAVLDIFSTNKGVLIPRVLDTASVTKPLEGLIIYNKNSRSPYYYNGSQWLSLGARLPSSMSTSTDKITYQVSGTGFSATEEEVLSLSQGVSNPTSISGGGLISSSPSLSTINIMKEMDINSVALNKAPMLGTKFASIEIKLYAAGSSIPYASYRLKEAIIESYQVSVSAGSSLIESVSIAFENYGFKDWVQNQEFGFNVITKTISTY